MRQTTRHIIFSYGWEVRASLLYGDRSTDDFSDDALVMIEELSGDLYRAPTVKVRTLALFASCLGD